TKPLPIAADDPTSTFWQRAIFPTLETHAASCGSHRAVESPSRMASFSRDESFATSKNVFWIASRYFLSELPAADSFTKGNTHSEVSLSRVRSSASCSGPGSASSTFAGGGVVAGVPHPGEVCGAGFGAPHSCEGGGAVWSV